MSENDLAQLGNIKDIKQFYQLPDEVHRIVNISKILIIMENEKQVSHQRKPLDEIDLDIYEDTVDQKDVENDDIVQCDSELDEVVNSDGVQETGNESPPPGSSGIQYTLQSVSETASSPNAQSKNYEIVKYTKKRKLVPWTAEQKTVEDCEILKGNHLELLSNKDWQKIKVFVQNSYTKSKK